MGGGDPRQPLRTDAGAADRHRGSQAGKIAFASFEVPGTDWSDAWPISEPLQELFPEVDGLQVELGGGAFGAFEEPESEALGLAFAIVILVVAFGSVLAMGLPIGVALAGIIVGSMIATILSNTFPCPTSRSSSAS